MNLVGKLKLGGSKTIAKSSLGNMKVVCDERFDKIKATLHATYTQHRAGNQTGHRYRIKYRTTYKEGNGKTKTLYSGWIYKGFVRFGKVGLKHNFKKEIRGLNTPLVITHKVISIERYFYYEEMWRDIGPWQLPTKTIKHCTSKIEYPKSIFPRVSKWVRGWQYNTLGITVPIQPYRPAEMYSFSVDMELSKTSPKRDRGWEARGNYAGGQNSRGQKTRGFKRVHLLDSLTLTYKINGSYGQRADFTITIWSRTATNQGWKKHSKKVLRNVLIA